MDIAQLQDTISRLGVLSTPLKPLHDVAAEIEPEVAAPESEFEQHYPVYVLAVAPIKALATWEKLYALIVQTGRYPVILGGRQSLMRHYVQFEHAQLPPAVLREAAGIDARQWFDRHGASAFEYDADDVDVTYNPAANFRKFLEAMAVSDEPEPIEFIGLVDTPHSWEVPAYLSFGNWNACHRPAVHVAIQRYWHERYQAELVTARFDTLICRTGIHVTDKASALALANDQYNYAPDIVDQGYGSIEPLAAELIRQQAWYFWWD
jgi:hypothetical protein